MNGDAEVCCLRGSGQGIAFVVFSIGNDEDHLTRFAFRIERVCSKGQGCSDCGALKRNGFRANGIEKQLYSREVLGQWCLHISLSSEHNEADPIAIKLLYDAL